MSGDSTFGSWEDAVLWLRSQPAHSELVRAAYYDDPLIDAAARYWQSKEWQAVRTYLPDAKGAALDLGAGRGIASYALAREGFSVISVEPDASEIVGTGAIRALAANSGLRIKVVQKCSEHLPFQDRRFDVIFARAVLHHTHDLTGACREAFRVLKPGGVFIVVREHVISSREDLNIFLNSHPLHNLYGGENAFLLSEYLAALQISGFLVDTILRPLLSPINYAPNTPADLRDEIVDRLAILPRMRAVVNAVLTPAPFLSIALRLLSCIDSRPGRLYSFVCKKPKKG